jgi:hypothetical protein
MLRPGIARRQVPVLLLAQEKGTKEKGTPLRRSFGLPSPCRSSRAAAELVLRTQTVLAEIPRLDRHSEAAQEGAVRREYQSQIGKSWPDFTHKNRSNPAYMDSP